MTELEPEAHALVAALREDRPAADQRARMRRRLLAAGALAGASTSAEAAAAALKGGAGAKAAAQIGSAGSTLLPKLASLPLAAKLVTAGLVVGATVAVPAAMHWPSEPAPRPPAVATAPAELAAPQVRAMPAEAAAPDDPEESPASPKAKREPAPEVPAKIVRSPSQRAPGPPESRLGEESALLIQALQAMAEGEHATAAYWLDRHRHQFSSDGLLTPERQRIRRQLQQPSLRKKGNTP